MAIKSIVLKNAATVAVTGGTDVAFASDSAQVVGGLHQVDTTATDYRTMSTLVSKVRQPVYDKTKARYTLRGKKHLTLTDPIVLADGSIEFPHFRVECEDHPEWTNARKTELRKRICQLVIGNDAFWNVGSQE